MPYGLPLHDHADPARCAWIIDTDHLSGPTSEDPEPEYDATGTTGPSTAPEHLLEQLRADPTRGVTFRMYDGDDELYYTGRLIALDEDGKEETWADAGDDWMAPLDDFGMPDSSCTSIQYQDETGAWVTL